MNIRFILQKLFSSIIFETVLFFLITASIISAVFSLLFNISYLETINVIFCLIFCVELSIRLVIAEDKHKYFKNYWIDWIASIPWDFIFITLFTGFTIPLVWTRFFRFIRLSRMARIINIIRTNSLRRLTYQLKKQLEKSLPNQFLLLAVISLISIIIFAAGYSLLNRNQPLSESLYFSLITLISSDSIFSVYDKPLPVKVLTLILAFLGIVLFNGVLIAIVVTRLTDYLNSIRAGKGLVMERGHLLILGDHPLVPFLIDELHQYCKTEDKKISVVLLREDMTKDIRSTITSSNPLHLEMVSLPSASSAIVLGNPLHSTYQNESSILKSFLTIKQIQQTNNKFSPQIFFSLNEKIKQRYMHGCHPSVGHIFDINFFSAKILVATLINPHKLSVFRELFTFSGSEFHFYTAEKLTGLPFYWIYENFKQDIPLGIERSGTLLILPAPDEIIIAGDRLIVLAKSEQSVEKSIRSIVSQSTKDTAKYTHPDAPLSSQIVVQKDIQTLNAAIIGMNSKLPHIIEELLKINSTITIIDNQSRESFENEYRVESGSPPPPSIKYVECNFRKLHEIQSITQLKECNSVLILADQDEPNADFELIDADTIYKVLKMRQLKKTNEVSAHVSLVAEIISQHSEKALSSIPDVSFVMTPKILGQLVSMFLIEPHLKKLLSSIVQKGDISIEVIEYYKNTEMPFSEISREYIKSNIACIGFIRDNQTKINPVRSTIIKPSDLLIVLIREARAELNAIQAKESPELSSVAH